MPNLTNTDVLFTEIENNCWPDTLDTDWQTFSDRFGLTGDLQCWTASGGYLQEIKDAFVNALTSVAASWALTVFLPLTVFSIFASGRVDYKDLIPEVLHHSSQRLLVYKVIATVTMFAMLYDTLDSAKLNLKTIVNMTQIISLSISLAIRPLITNVIDGLYLAISNGLKKDDWLSLNGVPLSKITKLNLTTVELQPLDQKTIIRVPYAMLASSIVTYGDSPESTSLPTAFDKEAESNEEIVSALNTL